MSANETTYRPRRKDLTAAERVAAARQRGIASRVWDPNFDGGAGGWVRPDPHKPSAYSYGITRCACCLRTHSDEQRRQVRQRHVADFEAWPEAQTVIDGQRRVKDRPGLIYMLGIGDYIKIGYTTNWAVRRAQYPPFADVLAGVPGTPENEADILAYLRPHMAYEWEWFNPDPQLIGFMFYCALLGRVEVPDTPSARPVERLAATIELRPHGTVQRAAHRLALKSSLAPRWGSPTGLADWWTSWTDLADALREAVREEAAARQPEPRIRHRLSGRNGKRVHRPVEPAAPCAEATETLSLF